METPLEQSKSPRGMTAAGRYESLRTIRDPYVRRAEAAALLTIPGLFPLEGSNGSTKFPDPFQSLGARGVNNLAAKLLLALFHPGFFRLKVDDLLIDELVAKAGQEGQGLLEEGLSKVERGVITRLEQVGARTHLFDVLKQLIVAGNCLIQVLPNSKLKIHYLNQYVVKRDPQGNVLEVVTKQTLSRMALPPKVELIVMKQELEKPADRQPDPTIDLFTRISRVEGKWEVYQEVLGERVPDTDGTYPLEKSPFIALRFTAISGEDYGRGFVEEYIGDLRSLENLSRAIVEGTAISAKTVFLVKPGKLTQKRVLAQAPNGAVVDGDEEDVGVLRTEKQVDFAVAKATIDELKRDLAQAFLLNSSIQRNAERVTAEEIRFLANELEQALGGIYSILGQELQLPLVSVVMHQMQKKGELPALPEDVVGPQIVTGVEALGRTSDSMKLDLLLQGLGQTFGPEVVAEYINVGEWAKLKGAALSLNLKGLIRSEEEVQRARQQRSVQALAEKLGGPAINASAKVAATEQQPQ